MDITIINRDSGLKCEKTIKIMSIIALVCAAVSGVAYAICGVINVFISICLVYVVLFCLYAFKFVKKPQADIFLLGLLFILNVFFLTRVFPPEAREEGLLIIIIHALAFFAVLFGFYRKIWITVVLGAGLLYLLFGISIYFVRFLCLLPYFDLSAAALLLYISMLLLYLASLLLFLLNKTTKRSMVKKTVTLDEMTPDRALKVLKEKFDLGMITEEEYQTKRTEIISKL